MFSAEVSGDVLFNAGLFVLFLQWKETGDI